MIHEIDGDIRIMTYSTTPSTAITNPHNNYISDDYPLNVQTRVSCSLQHTE